MEIHKAISEFAEAGLVAEHHDGQAVHMVALGDITDAETGIQCAKWAGGLEEVEGEWKVSPPPHPCPGPGVGFLVGSLAEAVNLTTYLYGIRDDLEGNSTIETMNATKDAFLAWKSAKAIQESMPDQIRIYAVKCPRCSQEAKATMVPIEIRGTYREATARFAASRINCTECGYIAERSEVPTDEYQLWYTTSFRGHRLWAVNDQQLDFLIDWLSGDLNKTGLTIAMRAYVETLPKWLLRHREEAVHSLRKMRTRS